MPIFNFPSHMVAMLSRGLRSSIEAFATLAHYLKREPKNPAVRRILARIASASKMVISKRELSRVAWDLGLLCRLRSAEAVVALYRIASGSEYPVEVRMAAAHSLREVKGGKPGRIALVALALLSEKPSPEEVRISAVDSQRVLIDRIKDPDTNRIALAAFYRMLTNPRYPPGVRRAAAELLGRIKGKKEGKKASDILMDLLFSKKEDISIRIAAAVTLVRSVRTYTELEALMGRILSLSDGRISLAAMKSIPSALASRFLYDVFLDPRKQHDVNMRIASADRLAFLGTPESIRVLNRAAAEPGWVGLVAIDALLGIKDKSTLKTMSEVLRDREAEPALEKRDADKRAMAARALAGSGAPQAQKELISVLGDPKEPKKVQLALVDGLRNSRSTEAADALYSVLMDKERKTEVREAAARALDDTGTLRARALLESAGRIVPVSNIIANALETKLTEEEKKRVKIPPLRNPVENPETEDAKARDRAKKARKRKL